jgi:hypothetical protein
MIGKLFFNELELEVTKMHVVMHTHCIAEMPALRRQLGLAETIPRTKLIYQNGKKGLFYFIVLIQSQTRIVG